MAGPCSIESAEQFESIVKFLKTQSISIIRGGIFKPRTNPKDFSRIERKSFPYCQRNEEKGRFSFYY